MRKTVATFFSLLASNILTIVITNRKIIWVSLWYLEIYQMDQFFKNIASSEGDQPLAGAFHPIMDKIEADSL